MTAENLKALQEEVIYCIPMMAQKLKQPIKDHCFGDCGKISLAGAIDTEYGPCWVCCEKLCPHLAENVGPIGTVSTGETVFFRVIK